MSFWSQNSTVSSQIDDLLSKEDVNIKEVLDEAEVLQECKSQNKTLIEYLAKTEILRELIQMATREPVDEVPEKVRYKYANIACELLTSEVPLLTQTLANDASLLNELYAFLECEPPLNPLLASFFSRIMAVLISKISEQNWFSYQMMGIQVIEFIKGKGNGIELLLRHMGTSAIMDLIHKFYIKVEGDDIKNSLLEWFDEGKLVERLVDNLSPNVDDEIRTNSCQLLCDLILSGRAIYHENNDKGEPDRILKKLESEEIVKKIITVMVVEPRCEGSIVGGISVLLTLLHQMKRELADQMYPTPDFSEPSSVTVSAIAEAIIPLLPHILDILKTPPYKPPVRTTFGTLETPLGATRVEVARLLAVLTSTQHEQLLQEIQRLELLNVLLDLFFQYPWNSFLHAQVEAMVEAVFMTDSLGSHALTSCKIIQRILTAWQENDAQQKDFKPRKGYMGHLIRIANHTAKFTRATKYKLILDPSSLVDWEEFVANDLSKCNNEQVSIPEIHKEKQEEVVDDDAIVQQLYRRYYHFQAAAAAFPGNFHEGQFNNDNDDNGGLGILSKPTFLEDDADEDLIAQASLFEQVCSQKLQTLDDDDELWASIMNRDSSDQRDTRAWNDEGSSDEETSLPGDEDAEGFPAQTTTTPLETSNPWSSDVLSASSPDQGWANFEASPFLANFGFDLSSTIATSTPGDIERVPFDLTPTETQLFPTLESQAPTETPPNDIDSSVSSSPKENTNSEKGDQGSIDSVLETAEIVDSINSAIILAYSDLVEQVKSIDLSESSLSCTNTTLNSTSASKPAAFAPETVIDQTDVALPSNIPSESAATEVATQIAQLLTEVSAESETNVSALVLNSGQLPIINSEAAPVAAVCENVEVDKETLSERVTEVSGACVNKNSSPEVTPEVTEASTKTQNITEVPVLEENSALDSDNQLRTSPDREQVINGPVTMEPSSSEENSLSPSDNVVTNTPEATLLNFTSEELPIKDNDELCESVDGSETVPNLTKSKVAAINEDVPSPSGPVTTI